MEKFEIQKAEYEFPYHYLPHFDKDSIAQVSRYIPWGREYLVYVSLIADKIKRLQPQSILDVGCGDGRLLGMIGGSIGRRVGIDLNKRAINFARAFEPKAEWRACDIAELNNEEFDCVSLIEVLEHIPVERLHSFLDLVVRRIKPGGMFVVSVPTKVIKLQPKHYRHYDRALLLEHLKPNDRNLQEIESIYAYRQCLLWEQLLRFLCNKHWEIRNSTINSLVWNYIIRRLKLADEHTGKRLVVWLKKND